MGGSLDTVCNIIFFSSCNWHCLNLKTCAYIQAVCYMEVLCTACALSSSQFVHLAVLSLCTWRLKPVWPLPLSGSDALSMQQVPQSHHDQHICCQTLSSFYNHFEHWPRVCLVFFSIHRQSEPPQYHFVPSLVCWHILSLQMTCC